MSVSEILFVVAGALLGLAFQGGMFLFLIPFAVVAFSLAIMNRLTKAAGYHKIRIDENGNVEETGGAR